MQADSTRFTAAFEETHGCRPYLWQHRLYEEVCLRGWPDIVAAPTGAGKTAALDVALACLAFEPGRDHPRRIIWATDRVCVMDAALARARALQAALADPKGGAMREMREALERLQGLGGAGAEPLAVEELRFCAPGREAWCRSPTQPTIVCTSVDQLGSRLLFRGYGAPAALAALDAGLLANDALIVLDEPHFSAAFEETLQGVARWRLEAERPCPRPFAVTRLTAAPAPEPGRHVFSPSRRERSEPRLARRLSAAKRARLVQPSIRTSSDRPIAGQARPFVTEARSLAKDGAAVVAILVNHVSLARAIHAELTRGGAGSDARALLLTGRSRPAERDLITAEWRERSSRAQHGGPPLFIVGAQGLEVGTDFDVPAMVTQLAPLDVLVHRLGRLNRRGIHSTATAVILALKENLARTRPDPLYGDRLATTWTWLCDRREADGTLDVAPETLARHLEHEAATACFMQRREAPVLRQADVDFLATTSPVPWPSPHLPLFLYGDPRIEPDVSIVWRSELEEDDLDRAAALLPDLSPPRHGEALAVPLSHARAWLRDAAPGRLADAPAPGLEIPNGAAGRCALRYRAGVGEIVQADEVGPGDLLVVPGSRGGCDGYGWRPNARRPVADLAGGAVGTDPGPGAAVPLDDDVSSHGPQALSLEAHADQVATCAAWLGEVLGLGRDLCDSLRLAGRLHDAGKADPRYQAFLGLGRPGGGGTSDLLAKTDRPSERRLKAAAWQQAGLPRSWRHEALSVRLAVAALVRDQPSGIDADLVLWLVGTHHGQGRPFFVHDDPWDAHERLVGETGLGPGIGPERLDFDWNGEDWAGLFERLRRRYGVWGLAFLEALMRLADTLASDGVSWAARETTGTGHA